jgi:tetratricopeptide (TPR) repeat protein
MVWEMGTSLKNRVGIVRAGPRTAGILILFLVVFARGVGTAEQQPAPHLKGSPSVNQDARLNQIRTYLESKRTAEALRMATELSAEQNNDVQLHLSLGVLLASEEQYKPAQLELEKADALQPGTFEILYSLGQVFLLNGDYPKAELVSTRALKLKPESPETLYVLAQVYSKESRYLDALDLLVRAQKIAPENPDILFLMAQTSISQKYFEDAIPLLEKAVQIEPQRSDIRAALGESYYMAGKIDKAIAELEKVTEVEPSSRTYALLGLSHTHLGRFDQAKQDFQNGLKLDPHSAFCLFHLGYIAKLQGDNAGADAIFQKVLRSNPGFPDALLELANLRIEAKRFSEAEQLLRKYVHVSSNPATGYYKLAMVERRLHETAAADRDLAQFQTLSKSVSINAYPYENLFDYLDNRSKLDARTRDQQDLAELTEQVKNHPDQPDVLYHLAEVYLKSGKIDEARSTIAQLDKVSSGDSRVLAGTGVLLARYHLYDEAIQHFQAALHVSPDSDEINFDLANAYFRKGRYSEALDATMKVSPQGRKDDSYLALLGDIYAHLGDTARATEIFQNAINRNPENDQDYLSLSLLQLRNNNIEAAKQTLAKGRAHIPGSGKILWGQGLASALEGNTEEAAQRFEHAVDLLPEWPGSYSTLGVFYFQTGQIEKAREVLDRFKNSNAGGGLDVNRIEQVLAQTPATSPIGNAPMSIASRKQLLQLALLLADKTL